MKTTELNNWKHWLKITEDLY